jgi:four helix bundle protein
MKTGNLIRDESYHFVFEVIKQFKVLNQKREFVMSRQLLRSGTSIGANVREAINGQSRADFIHKLAIAQMECDESMYWIELLKDSQYNDEKEFNFLYSKAQSILKILKSIILSTKRANP